ncbi:hypothetical protein RBH76_10655 [Oscillospiraceae bacterium MB24-C1]|nr:hypothetical protein RBH76_10655 [Oscillospiraceae bacterium MB24-C1]
MNSNKIIAHQTSDNLSFDERTVLKVYRENKEFGENSLLLPSEALGLLPYINSVKISAKTRMDADTLLNKSISYFLCYGYIEAPVNVSLEEINREVSKSAELGLLGFEQSSQHDKFCCISDVCIYKPKSRFSRRQPLAGVAHANLTLEPLSNWGVFTYPFFNKYAPVELLPTLRPKCSIILTRIAVTDIVHDDRDKWKSHIDKDLIVQQYQRPKSRLSLFS